MAFQFELYIAKRYLKAKRRQSAISVITAISIVGVAAGVMALVIAIAINNGFRTTLQKNILGATAHITVVERDTSAGIQDWRGVCQKLAALPGVKEASPALYEKVFMSAGQTSSGVVIKGIDVDTPRVAADLGAYIKSGSLDTLRAKEEPVPYLLIGTKLAEANGLRTGNYVQIINPIGEMTPFGPRPSYHRLRIGGTFETGFFDVDSNFAFMSLGQLQRLASTGDVVNAIELKVVNLDDARAIAESAEKLLGNHYTTTDWMDQNKQLLGALRMEKIVSVITIGLIQLVAALNIFIVLVMMVMEKQRDIAILLSMGARLDQIRKIFIYQGLLIGITGAAIGLVLGYGLCFIADHYRLITLSEEIYSIPYVPFQPNPFDAVWITLVALGFSLIATIYPAQNAAKVLPAEALRYE